MWKIPFTDRDTDRYRLRVPTEFTDLPTLLRARLSVRQIAKL